MRFLNETAHLQSNERLNQTVLNLLTNLQKIEDCNVLKTALSFISNHLTKTDETSRISIVGELMASFSHSKDDPQLQGMFADSLAKTLEIFSCNVTLKRKFSVVGNWKAFVIEILKKHFTNARYMDLLSVAIEKLYGTFLTTFETKTGVLLKDLHDMIVAHSKFLTVFIDEDHQHSSSKGIIYQ